MTTSKTKENTDGQHEVRLSGLLVARVTDVRVTPSGALVIGRAVGTIPGNEDNVSG